MVSGAVIEDLSAKIEPVSSLRALRRSPMFPALAEARL